MRHRSSRRSLIHLPGKPAGAWGCFVAIAGLVGFVVVCGPLLVTPSAAISADALEANGVPPEPPLTDADREHWAFQPVRRVELPEVRRGDWCRTPIDRFILARLEAAGLSPQPEADRATLLRRVTFDLTGMPPTIAEIDAFLADGSPDAYERVVDRLLGSPAYGERWAQHWLDLARFAETDGFEFDGERPNAWRYRDWVIDAFNRDLPFDAFVRLQLAGDELKPGDADAAIATGFLLCGPDMPDLNNQQERRSTYLNDLTGTVGSVFLGLQVGCAQCHDHKFDPISQYDFYRMRAFFDPIEIFKDHPLPEREPPQLSVEMREAVAKLRAVQDRVEQIEEGARKKLLAENPDIQPKRDELIKALSSEDRQRHADLSKSLAELKKTVKLPEVAAGRIVRESVTDVKPSRFLIRGEFRREGPEVSPAVLRVVSASSADVASLPEGSATTGRRKGLADWLVRGDHPLTARVAVNRIWQHHFGRGLVETASDFGRMGMEPTHPDLLDWLADEFVCQGWTLKSLHRTLVCSAVYRQASRPAIGMEVGSERERWDQAHRIDPANRLLSRMPRQRLEGEAIRDAMLAAAGRLNFDGGGPGVRPPLPPELVGTLLKNQWNVTPREADHWRRSVYLFIRRNLRYPLFEAFDRPDTNASCPRRNRSTIAPQALILLNSELSLAAARGLAGRLISEGGESAGEWIALGYRLTLGRPPREDERSLVQQFLLSQSAELQRRNRLEGDLAAPMPLPPDVDIYSGAALTDFCLALFNSNEFLYVD